MPLIFVMFRSASHSRASLISSSEASGPDAARLAKHLETALGLLLDRRTRKNNGLASFLSVMLRWSWELGVVQSVLPPHSRAMKA